MNMTEIAQEVADGQKISRAAAGRVINEFLHVIANTLKKGESVSLPILGTFIVKDTPERMGRNPGTGEPVTIKAGRKVTFKAAKSLKETLN